MRPYVCVLMAGCLAAACTGGPNVEQERNAILALEHEFAEAAKAKDTEKFLSYYAPDASVYQPGAPVVRGSGPIRQALTELFKTPGLTLQFAPTRAEVGAGGDVAYTVGTYQMSMPDGTNEVGKYLTVWRRQADGSWKVAEDIFNADAPPQAPASPHVMAKGSALAWGDPPPSLPPGAKLAVVSGNPTNPGPFTIRIQMPAGYRVAPHSHPTDEHVTILSGTGAVGMGDKFDQAALQDLSAGDYALMPARSNHFFVSRTASTLQIHGNGPFVLNYVNPADDPSKK